MLKATPHPANIYHNLLFQPFIGFNYCLKEVWSAQFEGIPIGSRAHHAAHELALERRRYAFPEQAPGSVHPAFDRSDGNPYDVCSRFVG